VRIDTVLICMCQSLEEQNSSLVDKNASLEEDYRKVSSYKPLVDSYKAQVGELEEKLSSRNKEVEVLKFDFEQTKTQLKISDAERAKDREALELYQERVQELELMGGKGPKSPVSNGDGSRVPPTGNMSDMTEAELLGGDEGRGLSGELEDALSGTTMTDLKLQIRKLKLDLKVAQANKADSSRIIVLENLLEDANRMKARYEQDYLSIHRENLLLQNNLEEIRNGKSLGDG
jgi:protein HOOK3